MKFAKVLSLLEFNRQTLEKCCKDKDCKNGLLQTFAKPSDNTRVVGNILAMGPERQGQYSRGGLPVLDKPFRKFGYDCLAQCEKEVVAEELASD